MPKITADDREFFYVRHRGDPLGFTLLLVHGAGGSHLSWPAELRRLSGASVVAIDLPGHGRSSPPGCDTIQAYADDVARFIAATNLDRVVIMGHSLGGAVALNLALRHHPKLSGLVLIGAGARLRVAPAILDQLPVDFAGTVEFILKHTWSAAADEELIAAGRGLMLEQDPIVYHGDFKACNSFDAMGSLDEIQLPTLVISGDSDLLTPAKYGKYLADNIPGARFVIIEKGGHMLAMEQPEAVAASVGNFLADIGARQDASSS